MADPPPEFFRLSNLRPIEDGARMAITIECRSGESAEVSFALSDVADIISYLIRAAAIVTEQSGSVRPAPVVGGPQIHVDPVPALGIGFGAASSPNQTLLLIRTIGVDVAFSIPSSELARVGPEFAEMANTLSAGQSRN